MYIYIYIYINVEIFIVVVVDLSTHLWHYSCQRGACPPLGLAGRSIQPAKLYRGWCAAVYGPGSGGHDCWTVSLDAMALVVLLDSEPLLNSFLTPWHNSASAFVHIIVNDNILIPFLQRNSGHFNMTFCNNSFGIATTLTQQSCKIVKPCFAWLTEYHKISVY